MTDFNQFPIAKVTFPDAHALAALGAYFATVAQGALADTAVQPADLALVATTGQYADLANRPVLAAVALSGSYLDLLGRPALGTVATSNNYADLYNLPTLGALAAKNQAAVADISAAGTPGPLTFLRGDGSWASVNTGDGREIELGVNATHILWRYDGDPAWMQLLPLADIQGDTGAPGPGIIPGGLVAQALVKASGADFDTTWGDVVVPADLATVATTGAYGDLIGAPSLSGYVSWVHHGADNTVARPAGAGMVIWYGSVQPLNVVAPDLVVRTDEAV